METDMPGENLQDGGINAHTTLLGGFCACFCTLGFLNTVGDWHELYASSLHGPIPNDAASCIVLTQVMVAFGAAAPFGWVFDRFGHIWLLRGGTLVYLAGLTATSFSIGFHQTLISQGFVTSLGASAVFTAAIMSVILCFRQRRGFALGTLGAGASIGGVVLPITVTKFVGKIGFPWTLRLIALIFLVVLILPWLAINLKPHVPSERSWIHLPNDRCMLLTLAASFCLTCGVSLLLSFIFIYARILGPEWPIIPFLPSMWNAASVIGCVVSGHLGDKYGLLNAITALSSFCILAALIPFNNRNSATAFVLVQGFLWGGSFWMILGLVVQEASHIQTGLRVGVCLAVQSMGILVGNRIADALVQSHDDNILVLQIVSASFFSLAVGLVLWSRFFTYHGRVSAKSKLED